MKIKNIKISHLQVPLRKPYKLSEYYGTLYKTDLFVTKITTECGLHGYGESTSQPPFTAQTPEGTFVALEKYLAPALIGCDPCNIAELHQVMDAILRENPFAKSGIDVAAHDILGKAAGMPLSHFLGGARHSELPIMGSIGGGTCDEGARDGQKILEQKYHSTMIKVGGDYRSDAERTIAIRKSLGADFPLIVDANQGWDVSTTLKYLKLVESANIAVFEQPIASHDIAGLKTIKSKTDVLISADESVFTLHDALRLIEEDAVDIFSIKISKHGGIYHAKRIIELASNFGIPCLFNSMIEEGIVQAASFALGVSTRNLYEYGHAYFSPLRLEADISNYSDFIHEGKISLPPLPGLGIEVKEEMIEKYTVKSTIVS